MILHRGKGMVAGLLAVLMWVGCTNTGEVPVERGGEARRPGVGERRTALSDEFEVSDPSAGLYDQRDSAVASDGTNFLVVWKDGRYANSGGQSLQGTRVDGAGSVLDPQGIEICAGACSPEFLRVAFNGTHYLVVWLDTRGPEGDLLATRVSRAGEVLDGAGLRLATGLSDRTELDVTALGDHFLVVWHDHRGDAPDTILGARVSDTGVPLDPSGLALHVLRGKDLGGLAVAGDGQQALLTWWEEDAQGIARILGTRVDDTGTALDPAGISIGTAWLVDYGKSSPQTALAYNGQFFLVAWTDFLSGARSDVAAARVTRTGTVLDSTAIRLCEAPQDQYFLQVAATGSEFLGVWQDDRADTADVYGGRVSAEGQVLDGAAGYPLSATTLDEGRPGLAVSRQGKALVAYTRRLDGPSETARVFARLLDVPRPSPSPSPPEATLQLLSTQEDTALPLTLSGTDANGEPLTYALVTPPFFGQLTGTAPALTYTPNADYHGLDTFEFTVRNASGLTSEPAPVLITVASVNDAPAATPLTVETAKDTEAAFRLTASDVDGDALTFAVGTPSPEAAGAIACTPTGMCSFTPAPGFQGTATASFTASDGQVTSAPAALTLVVRGGEPTPVTPAEPAPKPASGGCGSTQANEPPVSLALVLLALAAPVLRRRRLAAE